MSKKKKKKKKRKHWIATKLDKQIKNFVCQCKCQHCDFEFEDKLGMSWCPINPEQHHYIHWVNFDVWCELYAKWRLEKGIT